MYKIFKRVGMKFHSTIGLLVVLAGGREITGMNYAYKAYKGLCFGARWVPIVGAASVAAGAHCIIREYEKDNSELAESIVDYLRSGPSVLVKNYHPSVEKYLQSIAHQRTEKNIDFSIILGSTYASTPSARMVKVPVKHVLRIDELLHKQNRSRAEQEELDIVEGTVHHELTHIVNNDVLRYIRSAGISALASFSVLDSLRKISMHSLAKQGIIYPRFRWIIASFYGMTGIAGCKLGYSINKAILKPIQELRADDGVPSERRLLDARAKYIKSHHELEEREWVREVAEGRLTSDNPLQSMQARLIIKAAGLDIMDKYPILYDLAWIGLSHPCSSTREERIRARIAKLEKNEANSVESNS